MEWVLAGGGVAIVAVVVLSVVSAARARRREQRGRRAYDQARSTGAQPASLHPRINLQACIGSGTCVEVCPEKDVLAVVDGKAVLGNPTACIGHGECLRACPTDAIELVLGTEKRGVDIPMISGEFETNVEGLYIVGELGGMGLIYNAMTQGLQCIRAIARKPPPKDDAHQVLIVGAGPAGLAASLAARDAGLSYLTVDQETLGGTVLQYPRHKIVMTRPVELPLYGKLQVREVSKESLLEKWEEIVETCGIEVRQKTRVEAVSRDSDGRFRVKTSAGELTAHRVVLAIGRRGTPRKLNVPGEDLSKVTYRLLEPERYAESRCLVVGGGDAGVEAAIALGENGATVHLSYRRDAFSRIKPKNQQRLDEAVEAGRVTLVLSSQVEEIHEDRVRLTREDESMELPNDYVLIFAGGVLPTKFLQGAGVELKTMHGEVYPPAN